jgi:hypothetical protein
MSAYEDALYQLELAEAELALLKQELVLQHLVDARAPTTEASRQLRLLRETVDKLVALRTPSPKTRQAAYSLEMRFKLIALECSL